jgi:hypothetical protein
MSTSDKSKKHEDPLGTAQNIIKNSGNSFHLQVVDFLRANDWTVQISPYYTDNLTDKPREIDILTEKIFPFPNAWSSGPFEIGCQCYVECKYISKPIVFWFDKKDRNQSLQFSREKFHLGENNSLPERSRYADDTVTVAKLFAGGDGNALPENDIIFKAINQVLGAYIPSRRNGLKLLPSSQYRKTKPLLVYPIIICNSFDKFFRVNPGELKEPVSMKDETSFFLEVNYAYKDKVDSEQRDYFLIDVVNFFKMDDFLNKSIYSGEVFDLHSNANNTDVGILFHVD